MMGQHKMLEVLMRDLEKPKRGKSSVQSLVYLKEKLGTFQMDSVVAEQEMRNDMILIRKEKRNLDLQSEESSIGNREIGRNHPLVDSNRHSVSLDSILSAIKMAVVVRDSL